MEQNFNLDNDLLNYLRMEKFSVNCTLCIISELEIYFENEWLDLKESVIDSDPKLAHRKGTASQLHISVPVGTSFITEA